MTGEGPPNGYAYRSQPEVGPVRVDTTALDKLLEPFDRTDQPGFAVGVALRGVPQYRRGAGVASVELPIALSPNIRMRIGSATKQFCALAIMLLAEDGHLSIEDAPRQYIPELPQWAETFTLRHLMSHTSGMRDSFDLLFQTCGPDIRASPDTPVTMLLDIDDVNFSPGTSWRYNNAGYAVLSEIVERVSRQSFGDFLRTRVLDPVGMHDTMLRPVDTDLIPNSASLHVPLPAGGWAKGVFGVPLRGEGGMVSTVDDMLRWLKHLSDPIVGSRDSWQQMRTSYASHGYGLGLMLQKHRGLDTVHHAGAVAGGSGQAIKVLDHELDVVVLNNNGLNVMAMYQLVDAIIDACIPRLPPPPQDNGGPSVDGTFYSPDSGRVLSLVAYGDAQFVDIAGMMLPTIREPDGTISVQILPTDLSIKAAANGTQLHVTEFGSSETLERTQPVLDEDLSDLLGKYRSTAANIFAELSRSIDGYRLKMSSNLGSLDYPIKPIGPRLWQMVSPVPMPLGGILEFQDGSFLYSTLSTTRLRFDRT